MVATPGTWTKLQPPNNAYVGQMLLLTDGRVLINENASTLWATLTPNNGRYENGTWTQVAKSLASRLGFPAAVLQDGWVWIGGGEYYFGPDGSVTYWASATELYDPFNDKWVVGQPYPGGQLGDSPATLLTTGDLLCGGNQAPTYVLRKWGSTPGVYHWWPTGTRVGPANQYAEQAWVRLPDGSVLQLDLFAANATAERYWPLKATWLPTSPPSQQIVYLGDLFGPPVLLNDGRVLWFGGNGKTLFYEWQHDKWSDGPPLPTDNGLYNGMAVVMPSGNVLIPVSDSVTKNPTWYSGPTKLLEFDPTDNSFIDVTPLPPLTTLITTQSQMHLLLLPTGQVLFSPAYSGELCLYTPAYRKPTWGPSIAYKYTFADLKSHGVVGSNLCGVGEGTHGCGVEQAATNYPIIKFVDARGVIGYGCTLQRVPTMAKFILPSGAVPVKFSVIVNGVESNVATWN